MHAEISEWWTHYDTHPLAEDALPVTGAVAFYEMDGVETMVAAAWVYLDNSIPFSVLAWPIVNPAVRVEQKLDGLNHVVQHLTEFVRDEVGYKIMMTLSSTQSITRLMKQHGFVEFDSNITAMVKGI
jgi:hypothetical protein